ncbi:hypothetical protein CTAYLR_003818 [Chrysophaeum taylorii]|uniref:HECT-type E3 ubiquitin transferase n=1 Tax=Chrysophaeum taylorii TaxID=2483200 RepID=A0AAD7XKR5_9STRA|nr:hypothetical protein CTAYLR_003818 [Chrysophaeum taylorii]
MSAAALDVVSALTRPASGSPVYGGHMKKKQSRPPFLWRKRWVDVELAAFGSTSKVIVRKEQGSSVVTATVNVRRSHGGVATAFKQVEVASEYVEFELEKVKLRSTSQTPSRLIAALAALGWPNDQDDLMPPRLLLTRGALPVAPPEAVADEARAVMHGVRAASGPETPPGVAPGAVFYVPGGIANGRESSVRASSVGTIFPTRSTDVEELIDRAVLDDLIERAVASEVIDRTMARRMRERPTERLRRLLSSRLDDDDDDRETSESDEEEAIDADLLGGHGSSPRDSFAIVEERISQHGSYWRTLTHPPIARPRSFLRQLTDSEAVFVAAAEPVARPEPVRHVARAAVPPGAQPGQRLLVRVPQRREPVSVIIPAGAKPGSQLELTYTVSSSDYPHDAPEKAPEWRRNRLEARLSKIRGNAAAAAAVEFVVDRRNILGILDQLPQDPALWRRTWRFSFEDEAGVDAGGVGREFWQLLSETLFSPDYGLFSYAATDNLTYQICPFAGQIHERSSFRATGKLLAKALLDKQTLDSPLNRPLLKHILGVPVCFEDLAFVDASLYQNLEWLVSASDVGLLCQTFSVSEDLLGTIRHVDLVPNGTHIDVNDSNKIDYVEKRFQFALKRTGLNAMLRGFYDIIPLETLRGRGPEQLDAQDLEVILFGHAKIDVDDWKANTTYRRLAPDARRVEHFWKFVEEGDDARRTRLLQWSTGTARLPAGGFKHLQGTNGHRRTFELAGLEGGDAVLPRAHTCFNRIDLPAYSTYDTFVFVFSSILDNDITGFGQE